MPRAAINIHEVSFSKTVRTTSLARELLNISPGIQLLVGDRSRMTGSEWQAFHDMSIYRAYRLPHTIEMTAITNGDKSRVVRDR